MSSEITTTPQVGKPDWAQSRHDRANVARIAAGQKPRRRRWPWILLLLIVVAGVGGFVFLSQQPPPVAPVETAAADLVMQLNPSEISTIEPQTLQQTIKVSGALAPQRQTQLASQVAGRVVAVMARPGDAVRESDVLLQLDTESLQNQLNQQTSTAEATRAQLELAETQLARTTDLIERGLSPSAGLAEAQSSVDALRANLAALEGQVAAAELALDNATLRAPSDGVVSERTVEPGQTVQPGGALFTIVDMTSMEMNAAAPVGTSAQIAPQQAVSVTVEGLANQNFAGVVDRINPVALEGTRTIPVYVALDNPDGVLRGGMFATGLIVVAEQADALAVPEAALREDAEGFYLLKINGETVVRQGVEQGDSWGAEGLVEITSGLAAGDVVVTAPLSQLQPGDRFEMVEG